MADTLIPNVGALIEALSRFPAETPVVIEMDGDLSPREMSVVGLPTPVKIRETSSGLWEAEDGVGTMAVEISFYSP